MKAAGRDEHASDKWWIFSALAFGTFMGTLDGSITNIALPTIAAELHLPNVALASWVTLAYLLTSGSLFLLFGRLGELVGGKGIYLGGMGLFTFGSLLCSIAPSFGLLLASRVLQAVGSAMILAIGPAILTASFPSRQRGQALGLNSAIVSAGLAAGPTIGGILIQTLTWRSIFWINLPIGVLGILWAWRVLPEQPARRARGFDVPGTVLLSSSLLGILLATTEGQTWGWRSAPTLGVYAVGLVLLAAFIRRELSTDDPLLELRLFRIRGFSVGNASAFLSFVALSAASFLMPFFLVQGQGRTSELAGYMLTAAPIGIAAAAPISGALSDRFDTRVFGALGMAIVAASNFWLAGLGITAGVPAIVAALFLTGAGNGMFQSPNSSVVMGSVGREKLGTAAGMRASMRTLGQVTGIALAGAIVASRRPVHVDQLLAAHAAAATVQPLALIASIHDALHVSMLCAVLALVASLVRGRPPREPAAVRREERAAAGAAAG